jgi:hypothetical protein
VPRKPGIKQPYAHVPALEWSHRTVPASRLYSDPREEQLKLTRVETLSRVRGFVLESRTIVSFGPRRQVGFLPSCSRWSVTPGPRSGPVADALAAAEVAVAVTRARLATATGELASARRRRADAMVGLEAATDEVGRQEARLATQVRRAYMTGGVSGLSVVVQANDLRDLVERAVTLGYVIRANRTC